MLIQEKAGIITEAKEATTKTGKKSIVITHTTGASKTLQQIWLFEGSQEYNNISMVLPEIIGQKITQKIILGNE